MLAVGFFDTQLLRIHTILSMKTRRNNFSQVHIGPYSAGEGFLWIFLTPIFVWKRLVLSIYGMNARAKQQRRKKRINCFQQQRKKNKAQAAMREKKRERSPKDFPIENYEYVWRKLAIFLSKKLEVVFSSNFTLCLQFEWARRRGEVERQCYTRGFHCPLLKIREREGMSR